MQFTISPQNNYGKQNYSPLALLFVLFFFLLQVFYEQTPPEPQPRVEATVFRYYPCLQND
jgi:hypothetical protein